MGFVYLFLVSASNRGRYTFNREATMAQCPLIVPFSVTNSPSILSPPLIKDRTSLQEKLLVATPLLTIFFNGAIFFSFNLIVKENS